MKMPSSRLVLFNAAAILVGVTALAAVVRSLVAPASLAPCTGRYQTSMAFALERDGALITPTDIQARTAGHNAAVVENLQIVRLADGPVPVGMSVALPKGSSGPAASELEKGGVTFPWQPRSLLRQPAVCLSYQVLLPPDFNFGNGGVLPGVFGQTDHSGDRFLVQGAWRHEGEAALNNRATVAGVQRTQQAESRAATLPRGRWVKLEQEVVLNAPGEANGIARIWVDGALAVDRSDLLYRAKGDVGLAGVAADLFYSGDHMKSRSPADAKVLLSPFEIRWN
jgi:hypothetical protein